MAATVAYTEWKLGNCHYVKLRIFLRLLLRAEWNEVDEIWETSLQICFTFQKISTSRNDGGTVVTEVEIVHFLIASTIWRRDR